jgi:hypothetical protein
VRVEPDDHLWRELDLYGDRTLFQTREWVSFVAATQGAEAVVAALQNAGSTDGYFTGLLIRRFGIHILGSPFPGWGTDYMGFNLKEGASRRAAVEALLPFAFETLGCRHLELRDRALDVSDVEGLGFAWTPKTTFELDLGAEEDELLRRMKDACRRAIRKAEREGVTIEEAHDDAFADDYFAQLQDVYAKQSLVPAHGAGRVRELIRRLRPTGRLLLLRAKNPAGECIATAIFPAMNRTAYFWGGASWRTHQIVRPNEAVFWYAMRYWKARGMTTMDLAGGGDYKRKYGAREVTVPDFRKSRPWVLLPMRSVAQRAVALRQRLEWHGREVARLGRRRNADGRQPRADVRV